MKKTIIILSSIFTCTLSHAVDNHILLLNRQQQAIKPYISSLNDTSSFVISRDIKEGHNSNLVTTFFDNLNPEAQEFLRQKNLIREEGNLFDNNDSNIIKQLQEFYGLNATGVIDFNTWTVLYKKPYVWQNNVLEDSLKEFHDVRTKHYQNNKSIDKYIVINIPNQTAYLYSWNTVTSQSILLNESKVVVGKLSTKTPLNDFKIWGIKYNPDWTPTPNIIKRNVIRKDGTINTGWLKSHGIIVTNKQGKRVSYNNISGNIQNYRMRQPSGDSNALGFLKFETTSSENIYLHDTNEKHLFENNVRANSSGCIRVNNYMDFAQILLNQSQEYVNLQIDSDKTKIEKLSNQIPVYFTYSIAVASPNNSISYFNDIYSQTKFYTKKLN